MKLYYAPGTCSLSPHIVLKEAGFDFTPVRVDLKTHQTEHGDDYTNISPRGSVPMLELDDGKKITEGPAIVQYLADQKPESNLAPAYGTFERTRLQEALNFITSELHKGFAPIFKDMGEQAREFAQKTLHKNFSYVADQLKGKQYLLGENFSVADAYLFVMLTWAPKAKIDISEFEGLAEYKARVADRPHVKEALAAEGLQTKDAKAA